MLVIDEKYFPLLLTSVLTDRVLTNLLSTLNETHADSRAQCLSHYYSPYSSAHMSLHFPSTICIVYLSVEDTQSLINKKWLQNYSESSRHGLHLL